MPTVETRTRPSHRLWIGWLGLALVVALLTFVPRYLASARTEAAAPDLARRANGAASASTQPRLATLGQTRSSSTWQVTLLDFGDYESFFPLERLAPAHEGTWRLAELRIRNLGESEKTISKQDFRLTGGDGRAFTVVGQCIAPGELIADQLVRPGWIARSCVVFEIDPAATGLTLTALDLTFSIPDPS